MTIKEIEQKLKHIDNVILNLYKDYSILNDLLTKSLCPNQTPQKISKNLG